MLDQGLRIAQDRLAVGVAEHRADGQPLMAPHRMLAAGAREGATARVASLRRRVERERLARGGVHAPVLPGGDGRGTGLGVRRCLDQHTAEQAREADELDDEAGRVPALHRSRSCIHSAGTDAGSDRIVSTTRTFTGWTTVSQTANAAASRAANVHPNDGWRLRTMTVSTNARMIDPT
jgi:hypothetical protein